MYSLLTLDIFKVSTYMVLIRKLEGVPLFSEVKIINRMSETNVSINLADFVNANFRKAAELQLLKQHTQFW